MTPAHDRSLDCAEADALLAGFEDGTISLAEFHHRQHLAVATWLLLHDSYDGALDRMRRGLKHLLQKNGKTDGYDDAITVGWMETLSARLAASPQDVAIVARLNDVVEWALSDTECRRPAREAATSSGSTEG